MHTTAHLDSLELEETAPGQKRSAASMIFRIEQLLPSSSLSPTTTNTTSPVTTLTPTTSTQNPVKRVRGNPRPGVYTSQYTPKDTCSSSVPTQALLSSTATPTDGTRAYCQVSNGELIMSATLLRQIKLSEDVYSFNAIFELHGGQVRLRLVRDVAREDEIVAWFGEELVLLMGIPFLTPLNIQGNSRYTCHLCHLTFETPHPLKIHLALGCGRSAMDILWMRLHYALKAAVRSHQRTATHLSPTPAASSTSSASPTHSPPLQIPPRFSAFRPITAMQTLRPLATATAAASGALSYLPSISMAAAPLGAHPMNAAAQIEAIVSNMGASKQGHLCIYCGKVYSRKYGLKIHIRTHTGFKPLKCKFCLRPFGDPSNLNKHVRLHLQTQPSSVGGGGGEGGGGSSDVDIEGESEAGYQCRICHKSLARRRDLQRHMETRHGGSTIVHATTSTTTLTMATVSASRATTSTSKSN
ncbi:GL15563 [Drosophila persimilis]|uniref:GL15563 n=1 Tax=Drosophila persimilis TaxID=7234 RepID=B4H6I2_DROPE|nr:protein snail [Drosophila persimilis]EDW33410.1 GL15563 [Drosophila persimilis]